MRNLLGTLLLSAGVPMLLAGDEFGRTQRGNNNAYCHDGPLTWLNWRLEDWQRDLQAVTKRLIALRLENPALRPVHYAQRDEVIPGASEMHWFTAAGTRMTEAGWTDPENRTLQYLARSYAHGDHVNSALLVVHGEETPTTIQLPEHDGITRYRLLWSSADDELEGDVVAPGDAIEVDGSSMVLFRAE
jgi:glycogen operon protein